MTETNKIIKVLVTGDIGGSFQQLFKRVETVNKSAGPFDLLLCVGAFFLPYHHHHQQQHSNNNNDKQDNSNDNKESNNIEIPKELQPYINNEMKVPIPTYFIINHQDEVRYLNLLNINNDNHKLCDNLYYLGKSGVKTITGLNIAYLSGSVGYPVKEKLDDPSDISICKDDIDNIIAQSADKKIDILLTNQWSRGVLSNVDQSTLVSLNIKNAMVKGMDGIKDVAIPLSPVYHFSKEMNYYQRVPYMNPTSKLNPVTRFIALAPVDNDRKQKYLFAMNYQPDKVESSLTDATGFPFIDKDSNINKKQRIDRNNNRDNRDNNNNNRQSNYQQRNDNSKKRMNTQDCWFCLSQPNVESHLIVTIGSESYLAIPKGPIVEHHSLIVFIEHKPSVVSLSDSELEDVNKFVSALTDFHKETSNSVPVIFERHQLARFQNQLHGHLQVVPIPLAMADKVEQAFIDEATTKNSNIKFNKLAKDASLKDAVGDNHYFNVRLPSGEQLYAIIGDDSNLDLQFGRQVLVNLLNLPDRLNWKKCTVSKEEETEQALDFRTKFQPYFDKLENDQEE
ncbi:cwfJ family protein [Heterostelium album PN500]|uniref:CwfJ family protein n=1 Tax=Heterostelium pallidum (strain ATCC 26659 / Pp 5 / PN500) TaxID=670386 RepID=D3BPW1_HETP5|nr:cwfJ family protein [Heterostelium album PN500]EFA76244.1 cwfJ family protein [Heterostelium album PN500]|eukprot:XP_020428377.1 cwfJ family protein [Heterostelium album PN500]